MFYLIELLTADPHAKRCPMPIIPAAVIKPGFLRSFNTGYNQHKVPPGPSPFPLLSCAELLE